VSSAYLAQLASVRARHCDDDMTHERLAAMAMVELITGARAVDRRVPEVTVLIDLDTFMSGLHDHSVCETEEGVPVPPSTVHRLCCDSDIGRAILNAKGELLDLGRSQRTATSPSEAPPSTAPLSASHEPALPPDESVDEPPPDAGCSHATTATIRSDPARAHAPNPGRTGPRYSPADE